MDKIGKEMLLTMLRLKLIETILEYQINLNNIDFFTDEEIQEGKKEIEYQINKDINFYVEYFEQEKNESFLLKDIESILKLIEVYKIYLKEY